MNIPKDAGYLESSAFQGDKSDYFPENTVCSLPVFTSRNGKVFQAAFLFEDSPTRLGTIGRPFAWSLTPIEDSPEHLFSWCTAQDFVDTTRYPLGVRVSAFLPGGAPDNDQVRQQEKEIFSLFEQMLHFPFQTELSEAQQEVIARYKKLFLLLCCQGHFPFYDALSPDFFRWIGLVLLPIERDPLLPLPLPLPELPRKLSMAEEPPAALGMAALLEQLSKQFSDKIATDQQKERLFDQLHQELQDYKTGALEDLTRGIERDVILVIDDIRKSILAVAGDAPTPAGYQRLLGLFSGIEEDLTDLLYRQGVDPYEVEGNQVRLPQQKVLATLPTTDPAQDKLVAERLTQGWAKGEQIVRPEYVRVYLYQGANSDELADTKELLVDGQ